MAKETFTGPLIALGGVAGGQNTAVPAIYGGVNAAAAARIFGRNRPVDLLGWAWRSPCTGGPASKDRTGPGSISAVLPPPRSGRSTPSSRLARRDLVAGPAVAGRRCLNLTTYAAGRPSARSCDRERRLATTGVGMDIGLDNVHLRDQWHLTFTGTSVGNTLALSGRAVDLPPERRHRAARRG